MIVGLGLAILVLVLIGLPIGFAIILAGLLVIWVDGGINPAIIAQRLFSGMDSFALLAIPFFLLAGSLMSAGGLTERLVAFANGLVGRLAGGMAMGNVVASTLFSGISGSAVADTSVFARLFVPAMVRDGYGRGFSVAITAASSVVAPIIPPSILFIVYGVITNQSIVRLFLAGLVPGLLYSGLLLLLCYLIARQRHYPVQAAVGGRQLLGLFWRALPALLMPVFILVGIIGGVFTVTECSAIAVFYALLVGGPLYRELTLTKCRQALLETATTTGVIMIIVGAAKLFAWQLAYAQIPAAAVAWISALTDDPIRFLLVVNLFLLLVGTFLEANAALVMLVPILHPAALAVGVDPIQLGAVVAVNLCLGLITPPIGLCLNVACKVGELKLEHSLRDIFPFVAAGMLLLVVMSLWPGLSLWLPTLVLGP